MRQNACQCVKRWFARTSASVAIVYLKYDEAVTAENRQTRVVCAIVRTFMCMCIFSLFFCTSDGIHLARLSLGSTKAQRSTTSCIPKWNRWLYWAIFCWICVVVFLKHAVPLIWCIRSLCSSDFSGTSLPKTLRSCIFLCRWDCWVSCLLTITAVLKSSYVSLTPCAT